MSTTDRNPSPAEALALVARTRAGLADQVRSPWWLWPTYGALMATLVMAIQIDSWLWTILALVVGAGGILALNALSRRRMGIWWEQADDGPFDLRWFANSIWDALPIVAVTTLAAQGNEGAWVHFDAAPYVAAALMFMLIVVRGRRGEARRRARLRTER